MAAKRTKKYRRVSRPVIQGRALKLLERLKKETEARYDTDVVFEAMKVYQQSLGLGKYK